jgi:glucose/arabinose dehydrogenase
MAPLSPPRLSAAFALIVGAVLALACPARAQLFLPTNFSEEIIYTGLDQSTGMDLLPDGRIFVVEKITGRVRLIVNGALATVDPVLTVPEVDGAILEQGLLGVVVDPGWPGRPYLYVHYTHTASSFIKVSRFTVGGDLDFTGDGSLTVDPATRYDILTDLLDSTPYHNGGTVRFGPDGMLYVSIGDDNTPCQAQDLTRLAGKILRLDVSGLPAGGGGPPPKSLITPANNPYVTHANENARLVCHRGMRNPFRFAIDPLTGALAIGDVGFEDREEITRVTTFARNMQWPIYEGDLPGPTTCGGVDSTAWTWPTSLWDHTIGGAATGVFIYRWDADAPLAFPPVYDGAIFFNDFYGSWVRVLYAWQTGNGSQWAWQFGGTFIVDWRQASDGTVYYCRLLSAATTGPGEIRRIRYTQPGQGETDAPGPGGPELEFRAPYPSPSRAGVTFEYSTVSEGPVSLAVYDVGGRRVRSLVDLEREAPGGHRATWDGRDASGDRLPAGVYLSRLSVAGRILERRVVLTK